MTASCCLTKREEPADVPQVSGPEADAWSRTRPVAAELKARFEAGASIRSLAENTGRSYGSVHGQSADAEVALRSHGGATRGDAAS